jgi:hypothetical protein
MKMKMSSGILALATIGSFVAWRNRSKIQEWVESRGYEFPQDTERFRSLFKERVNQFKNRISQEKKREFEAPAQKRA